MAILELTGYLFFFFLKFWDSKKEAVASSTVSSEGEDTQTMRENVKDEILVVFYKGKCVFQQLDFTGYGSNSRRPEAIKWSKSHIPIRIDYPSLILPILSLKFSPFNSDSFRSC